MFRRIALWSVIGLIALIVLSRFVSQPWTRARGATAEEVAQTGSGDALGADSTLARDLLAGAEKGTTSAVAAVLDRRPGVINARNERGMTALHLAAADAHWETFAYLLGRDPDIQTVNDVGGTPLHSAAHHDRPDMVDRLIDRGADLSARNLWGMTPLHGAVFRGCPAVAARLLERGADPEIATNEGWTALHYANLSGHRDCVEVLRAAGASDEARDDQGRTPEEVWRERPAPAEIAPPLEDYPGLYHNVLPVWVENGVLYLKEFAVEELYPIGPDVFFCRRCPWKVEFLRDENGTVDRITLHFIRRSATGTRTGDLPAGFSPCGGPAP